ncbi:G:T/U mismatch-specific DNA glycosylase [Bacillus sp. 1NLA3E]|nr:G:T/U mismatch-specific DNA glycosylase [Bacillus sp. 1NLA3E]
MDILGEMKQMYMYEAILDILAKNGPASISSICQEMNQLNSLHQSVEKTIQPSQVKTAITRKKDLFKMKENVVFIDPEKDIQSLLVNICLGLGPQLTFSVDFVKNRFVFFEWNLDSTKVSTNKISPPKNGGNLEIFKKDLYRIRIWDWEGEYHPQGIVLDGPSWSIKLVTMGKVYQSEGHQHFPKDWKSLCRGLSKLTGIDLN